MTDREDDISREELEARVIYALFLPAVRLAKCFGVELSQMKGWLEAAYYHELRRDGLKMREISEAMGVSMSKVSLLSRQLKETFIRPEVEAELSRRIEFMLWAEPLSRAKLAQVLTDVPEEEVEQALDELLEEGRIREVERGTITAYELDIQTDRRVWDGWVARVDGLQDALGNVSNVVFGRFFRAEPRALARTLTFRVRREDLDALRELYEQVVFPRVVDLDAAAEQSPDEDEVEELSLSLFWAPYEYIKKVRAEGAGQE